MISEAQKYGIHLILGLVNNWEALGGRKQYVAWANQRGQNLTSDDDFFTNPMTKGFYKNHVKVRSIADLCELNSFVCVKKSIDS